MEKMVKGQRWMSEMEPELGLGVILESTDRSVTVAFPANDTVRNYATETMPLKRVIFKIGNQIKGPDGKSFTVDNISPEGGLLTYHGKNQILIESEICASVSMDEPFERLLRGDLDSNSHFYLRMDALKHLHNKKKSSVNGLLGGRINLHSHQIYIAKEVTSRTHPRVLLADEVGLGKTIEACLILHRMIKTGQVLRALILVPEALIHQWFVELLRRFSLSFTLMDRVYSKNDGDPDNPDENPFMMSNQVLTSLPFVMQSSILQQQILESEWDMIIIDEAHHLTRDGEENRSIYQLVEGLQSTSMLLLTGTPFQMGQKNHFESLQLLDPIRHSDYDHFLKEQHRYTSIASLAEQLIHKESLNTNSNATLDQLFQSLPGVMEWIDEYRSGNQEVASKILTLLLDYHGIGRVLFRNSRKTITGFPKRLLHLIPLSGGNSPDNLHSQLREEYFSDTDRSLGIPQYDFQKDPRIQWISGFIKENKDRKILVICRYQQKARALMGALKNKVKVNIALFIEDSSLIDRDRQAAWFSEPEGAQILICSEIGSEGRNFQFAQHLILFDLPPNPELLEQRIGRLDRIGQNQNIHLHLPLIKNTLQEHLFRWFHEGMNVFEKNQPYCHALYKQFEKEFHESIEHTQAQKPLAEKNISSLIKRTGGQALTLQAQFDQGRNQLLEMSSHQADLGEKWISSIKQQDENPEFKTFIFSIFEHYGVTREELDHDVYHLGGDHLLDTSFHSFKDEEGLTITFNRSLAILHEEWELLTWDHPLVSKAFDMLLGSQIGNCSCIQIFKEGPPGLILEACFVLECLQGHQWSIEQFLPITPIQTQVDHQLKRCPELSLGADYQEVQPEYLKQHAKVLEPLLPKMLNQCLKLAEKSRTTLKEKSLADMNANLQYDIKRLTDLKKTNSHIHSLEIEESLKRRDELQNGINNSRLRLDALRLIFQNPQ